jgi:hypothetical protein
MEQNGLRESGFSDQTKLIIYLLESFCKRFVFVIIMDLQKYSNFHSLFDYGNIIWNPQEVFRSEVRSTAMLSEITGKCWVMTVKGKEYFNYAPEGYNDDDVYVCEYRYSSRGRCFTKLKAWAFGSERTKLISREKPLEPIRVASVFRERVEKHKEELQQIEDDLEKAALDDFEVRYFYIVIQRKILSSIDKYLLYLIFTVFPEY